MTYFDSRAYELRCQAAAIESLDPKHAVTVKLSPAAAWLLRDLIGLCGSRIPGVSLRADLRSLNSVLGYRSLEKGDPSVSGWSANAVRLVAR